jgi:hypothetical protein
MEKCGANQEGLRRPDHLAACGHARAGNNRLQPPGFARG